MQDRFKLQQESLIQKQSLENQHQLATLQEQISREHGQESQQLRDQIESQAEQIRLNESQIRDLQS